MKPAAPLDARTQGRLALPFALVTLIWGSTWLAIHSQFGPVPTAWSVTYRFAVGAASMFAVAAARLRSAARTSGRWRSTSAGSSDCAASWAAPVKVASASALPSSCDKPISTAACCIASRKKNT